LLETFLLIFCLIKLKLIVASPIWYELGAFLVASISISVAVLSKVFLIAGKTEINYLFKSEIALSNPLTFPLILQPF
jgi:hypothetical protein